MLLARVLGLGRLQLIPLGAGLHGVIDRPRDAVADGHRRLLRRDERVVLEGRRGDQLVLELVEILDRELTIHWDPRPLLLPELLVERLPLLLLLRRRTERQAGKRLVRLLDNRLQLFSGVLAGVFVVLVPPIGVLVTPFGLIFKPHRPLLSGI